MNCRCCRTEGQGPAHTGLSNVYIGVMRRQALHACKGLSESRREAKHYSFMHISSVIKEAAHYIYSRRHVAARTDGPSTDRAPILIAARLPVPKAHDQLGFQNKGLSIGSRTRCPTAWRRLPFPALLSPSRALTVKQFLVI